MGFAPTIDQGVWDNLMSQTSQGNDYRNADGNLVRAKFKAPLRDAVKDAIGFWQHKEGQVRCDALDASIAEGNRLLSLDKDEFTAEIEPRVDFDLGGGGARRKYAQQMLEQYTNELEQKREKNCRVSGDKELDYAQQDLDKQYSDAGIQPPSTQLQQAGIGGNMVIYATIGAVALAGFFLVRTMLNKQKQA